MRDEDKDEFMPGYTGAAQAAQDDAQRLKRAYARGYKAGGKRKKAVISNEAQQRKENAFWQRAMIAVLPYCLSRECSELWKVGASPPRTMAERIRVAVDFSDDVLKKARAEGRL